MKCPICSAKISDTDAFCPNCGSAVKSETSGYMDSIDTSNLGENVGFGKRNTTGAQPVNAVPQQSYAQGQQSYGQPQNGYAQQSYPPPQNGNAQTPYGSAYEPYKIAPVTSAKKGIPKALDVSSCVYPCVLGCFWCEIFLQKHSYENIAGYRIYNDSTCGY